MTEPAKGWGLRIRRGDRTSHFMATRMFWSRASAIDHYNRLYQKANAYRCDRRKGEVLAVQVKLIEI